ncbi:nitronate monooxygenase [Garicola koreensis]|uniref:Propionate 3-nitronate monooxygenase n=1 Tax=Garicola koreensis TaxID=1262554 RepID=A0A7W5TZZ5_9MICC|nr:nitronate monooxygenase [Garicola koreensis]MBB3666706.1 NAD(P)H-dependent flavin oxidoreductase YrpB (nitropropane dioxygenase family) [Garicola koreensis]
MAPAVIDSDLPLVAAPMAGGPSSLQLAEAVGRAGGFPFLAAANADPATMTAQIEQARTWGVSFGVNLFIVGEAPNEAEPVEQYRRALAPQAAKYGMDLHIPQLDDDDQWPQKVELLCQNPVPVVSFTFGLPPAQQISRLRRAGSAVWATVTTAAEAQAAQEAGVDALVVQGPAAGGHSGTWDPARVIDDRPTAEVVRDVDAVTKLPLIAAGGVDGPSAVRTLLQAGAAAVQVGTLLLRTEESGASQLHKDALASEHFAETVVTRAFTGRPARGLRNGFVDAYEPHAVTGYPAVHHMTRELRRRAAAAGDVDGAHFWAGTGYRSAAEGPVARTIRHLAAAVR